MTYRLLGACLACAALFAPCGDDDGGGSAPSGSPVSFEVAPGVFATVADPPAAPSGSLALSDYYVLEADEDQSVGIGLLLSSPRESTVGLGFYTYNSAGQWEPAIAAVSLREDGSVLEGVFPEVPANVIVFEVAEETG